MIRADIRRWFHLALRRRDRWEREVEDEIKLHLALRAEQLMAAGATADDAYDEAVRRFGSLTHSRARLLDAARHREQRMERTEYFSDLRGDVAFALRTMARQKGWTAVTVITLALGIGATTAVFSVVSNLLLHPLPYPNAGRIVFVDQQPSEGNNTGMSVSITPGAELVRTWRDGSRSFEALEGYKLLSSTMATNGDPSPVRVARVFPTFTDFAGQRPLIGRMFTDADIAGGGRVVLLSEAFWRTRFGADRSVLGQSIKLRDTSYTIIGVMPEALRAPIVELLPRDAWLPLDVRDNEQGMRLIGRLREGATVATAARELDSLFARLGNFKGDKLPFRARLITPAQSVDFHDSLIMLTVAVGFVLLVACANVAHLLMARAATRQRELAVRAALGAGRGRLFRQLLTESLALTLSGCALGIAAGWMGLRGLVALRPASLSELTAAHLDATTLLVAIGLSIISGVTFGVLGAFQSARNSTHDALKSGATSVSSSRLQGRGRGLLVISEMALSAALVVSATMLVRSVVKLQRADLGFEPRGLYSIDLTLPDSRYPTAAARSAFLSEVVARSARLPGIRGVTIATAAPGQRNFAVGRLEIEGEAAPATTSSSFIDVNGVQANYFQTMGIRLVQGTIFTDTSATSRQVIVNAGFARKHWPSSTAVGHRLRVMRKDDQPWSVIVGVVADAATSGPGTESSAPFLYSPLSGDNNLTLLARTTGDATPMKPIRDVVKQLDAKLPAPIANASDLIARALAAPRFVMTLLAVFTTLALVLAAVGMYGVMSFTVMQKTREIGIRVALGASAGRIARSVMIKGAALAAIGAVIGLTAAAWGTKLIEQELYGIARSDSVSFAAAVVVLVGAAMAACAVPTRRALAVDPISAIRAD